MTDRVHVPVLIPAAGTPEQAALGIADSPALLAHDIVAKTKGRTDGAMALRLAEESAETFSWLRDAHGVPLAPVGGFLYPGHSVMRMVGTPNRTGGELMAGLEAAAERAGVLVLTQAVVVELEADGLRHRRRGRTSRWRARADRLGKLAARAAARQVAG